MEKRKPKIYDCFTFFNELDLLELRLETLNDVVDFFVLVEATKTFSNRPKKLFFDENKQLFEKFKEKIIHVIVDDMPEFPKDAWEMEYFQRNAIVRGLKNCENDDYIIISDVDEIPRSCSVKDFSGEIGIFSQDLFYYKFNCKGNINWERSAILKYSLLSSPQEVRDMTAKDKNVGVQIIKNGGWHFSYLGSDEAIKSKIESFSHQELNKSEYKDRNMINRNIRDGKDLFGRDNLSFEYVNLDETFPEYILKNKESYLKFIGSRNMNEKSDEILKKQLGFDLYGRYRIISDIIDFNRGENQSFRILDIGGRGNLLKKFLPNDEVYYLEPELESDDINFIKGDGCAIPLKDESYDWVTSADVFEHIPPKKRKEFMDENIRVAKFGVVLAAPFHSDELAMAEINANENYKVLSGGEDHKWLKEHIDNGLPEEAELEKYLSEKKLQFQKIHNNSLYLWQILLGFGSLISKNLSIEIKKEIEDFNYFYNSEVFYFDNQGPSYRKIYFIKKENSLRFLEVAEKNINDSLFLETIKRGFDIISRIDASNRMQKEKSKRDFQSELDLKNEQLRQRDREISFMRSSKFWKLREMEFKIKFLIFHPVSFVRKYEKKSKNLYAQAKLSLRREGVLKMFLRTVNFVIYGKGVLRKSEISRNDSQFVLEKYDIDKISNLEIDNIRGINFEKNDKPAVSIVIPVFNKWQYTYNCLESLGKNIRNVAFEVIVVDDGSTDETSVMMEKIGNSVYVKNEKNLGFVGSCNNGAKSAKGDYIVFLNNDTSVKKDWLESMLETFEKNDNVGLVGSKLIYADGRLQEAGGIIWKNQNAWNFGRLRFPDEYGFNYLKDVDYCSGASIMLPRNLFEKLGGFDEIFSPGYFEDADLAFRVRQAGLRTVYQPNSELFHFEGITSGNDLKSGMKKFQEINKNTFFERWHNVLGLENINEDHGSFLARDRSFGKKIILFMDNNVPTFDKDAGSFITFQYLKILGDLGYKIVFWPHNLAKLEPYTGVLQQMGIEVVYGNEIFSNFIKENGKYIDFAFISRPHVAHEYIDMVKENSNAKILYIPHDLHYLRERRTAEISKNDNLRKQSVETKKIERLAMEKADTSLFFSDKEVEIIKEEFPDVSAMLLPWIQEIENENPAYFETRQGIIFIGGYDHKPNIDAVKWFHDEVFPILKDDIPSIKVVFYGSNPTKEIMDLEKDNFKIAGFVEEGEVRNIFNSAKIFIAPLRFGAGFKGKIAKAMGNGLPVVTTEVGAEGIGLIDGRNALIVKNDAKDFAEKIRYLYENEAAWKEISSNSISHLRENFSIVNAKKKINEILEKV